jgi:hypothetical protein
MKRLALSVVVFCCALALPWGIANPAFALSPSEVFEEVSPSVWAVRGLDAEERPFSYGSAVVVGPGKLVTNCHVLAKAKAIQLRRENVFYIASLQHADLKRDLCVVSAKNFSAPAVRIRHSTSLKVGQRVFAVGNPERLALTLSEGLLSGLRGEEGAPILQTTAPLSPGSSGGGLFDEDGQLVGITTLIYLGRSRISQNLNFALPAEWIAEVPERAEAHLIDMQAGGGKNGMVGLPPIGAIWKYSFRDRQYSGPERQFTIRIATTAGRGVRESFSTGSEEERYINIDPGAVRFTSWRLTDSYSIIELAPYFFSRMGPDLAPPQPTHYPGTSQWRIAPARLQMEDAVTPSGTYKALRVDVTGTGALMGYGAIHTEHLAARFHYTAWYAPEVNRYVMVRHRTWNPRDMPISDEIVQLLEHRKN